jgi:hypothetical protein
MVDSASRYILLDCHGSRIATAVGSLICCKRLIEAVTWLGTSTSEMPSLTTIEALPISGGSALTSEWSAAIGYSDLQDYQTGKYWGIG